MTYYSLTTISSVGLGDLYPVNDFERIVAIFGMFCAFFTVSLIKGQLWDMVINLEQLDGQSEGRVKDLFQLDHFINQLRRFNGGDKLKENQEEQIRDFFKYRWKKDRNQFLQTDDEQRLVNELPLEVKNFIFTKFVFIDFLTEFRRLFLFKK